MNAISAVCDFGGVFPCSRFRGLNKKRDKKEEKLSKATKGKQNERN